MELITEKRRVTIYVASQLGLGIVKIEASAFAHKVGPCAQHGAAVHFAFVPKGGRSERTSVEPTHPSLLVLDGWGHPDPDDVWTEAAPTCSPDVTVQTGRHRSFSPAWRTEFASKIDPYIAAGRGRVVADYRAHCTA